MDWDCLLQQICLKRQNQRFLSLTLRKGYNMKRQQASDFHRDQGLLDLSAMLHKRYDIAPIIIIDEYDTPRITTRKSLAS